MTGSELEEGQQHQHIRYGRVTLAHVGDSIVAYDVHENANEPRYEFRGTFERDAELVDEEIVTDGGTSSGDTIRPWCGRDTFIWLIRGGKLDGTYYRQEYPELKDDYDGEVVLWHWDRDDVDDEITHMGYSADNGDSDTVTDLIECPGDFCGKMWRNREALESHLRWDHNWSDHKAEKMADRAIESDTEHSSEGENDGGLS